MSKSRKKFVKDRFEKKKMIAFKNKNKKIIEEEDYEEEIDLRSLQEKDGTGKDL
tara:strand:- start:2670 stop:2831 length:162 start_codon:yes stop_codon:yes gene_type:complete